MSEYYRPRRSSNLYTPGSAEPFRVSRSKIDLFLNCPRCFYLDRRLGVAQPPGFPFSLNAAVDKLLKKEFDIHRAQGTQHPLMRAYKIDAVPFDHPKMEEWRDSLGGGIRYFHAPTKFLVTGGVDDLWVNPGGEISVVDYKATAKDSEVNIDAAWQIGYKRQMEVYQWLFRQNGFTVSDAGYFVYVNGKTDRKAFDGKLEFDVKILPYRGNDAWVEPTLYEILRCLESDQLPAPAKDCDFCNYRAAVLAVEKSAGRKRG
ncbi:MAG: PD-(D/E)XK nuclease family protein [Patescibacteria group bacterium]|nr:PD-(D/E)XK nuclease family protein [Patescibacteria group bacterium]